MTSSVSSTVNALRGDYDPYSVSASVGSDGGVTTTGMTGDHTTDVFKEDGENGKMDFLTLLMAQFQNQDPMEPMDNTAFVAQLAQFTQLESLTSMETAITEMGEDFRSTLDVQSFNAQSMTNASSVSLIGKEVRLRQENADYSGKPMDFNVHLGDKSEVTVHIVDSDGEIVKSINVSDKNELNSASFTWDGTGDDGKTLDQGMYTLQVEGQESNPALYCFAEDVIKGVRFDASGPVIKVSGGELPIGNVLEVNTAQDSSTSGGASSLTLAQALALVGHTVKTEVTETSFEPESGEQMNLNLDLGGTSSATVVVKDSNGNIVDQMTVDKNGPISIDKKNYNGSESYTVSIVANQSAYFYNEGTINSVVNKNGNPQMKVSGMILDFDKILEIHAPV